MNSLMILIVIISFVALQTIEIFSFGSRVAGRYTKQLALGHTLQQTIYTASRFLLIFFLPTIAYLVESGISTETYAIMASFSLFISCLSSLYLLVRLNSSQKFFQKIFINYENFRIPKAIFLTIFKEKQEVLVDMHVKFHLKHMFRTKVLTSFVAYFFLSSGFFVAFLLSNLFYEYRLTLSQITPFFHGFGAVLVAFYLDPMLSKSMDNEGDNIYWVRNIYSIIFGRVISYFFASLIFLLIAIFLR